MMEPQKTVNLYIEANPNPNSLKFVANFMLFSDGNSFDFPDVESASDSPLALQLFALDEVERVFFMSNFITVTKKEGIEWIELREKVKGVIKEYLESGASLMEQTNLSAPPPPEDPQLVAKIKEILEGYVKPAVEQDGGAIVFESFNEGVVKVALQGSCSGCPSSTITLKAGIENILTTMVPEVKSVVAEGV